MKVDRKQNIADVSRKRFFKMIKEIKYGILGELGVISVVLQIVFPFLFYCEESGWTVLGVAMFSIFVTCLTRYMTAFYKDMTKCSYDDLPLPRKRFTRVDSYGFVEAIDTNDMPEIVSYVNELERYIDVKGLRENEE